MAYEIQEASLFSVGDYLRSVNVEIKNTLQEIAGKQVTPELASALHNLQVNYMKAAEYYTTVYRAVYGEVPVGLSALPLGIAAWSAWQWLIAAVVAGGILYTALQAFRNALQVWRDRVRAGVVYTLPPEQRGSAIDQLFPADTMSNLTSWLSENTLLVLGGILGFVLLTRR